MATVLVTSSDGILFRVETEPRSAPYERAYAAKQTAQQLDWHNDFTRVRSLDDLVAPQIAVEEILPPLPRPQLRLIQGGKAA